MSADRDRNLDRRVRGKQLEISVDDVSQSQAEAYRLHITMLGPLTVSRGGRELHLTPGVRGVLAALLAADGRPVSESILANTLWADMAPATHRGILQTYVSRLRRLLGDAPADIQHREGERKRIIKVAGGYRLTISIDELDLLLFRRLIDKARHAAANDECDRALVLYDEAMSLWHGIPFTDIDTLCQHPTVISITELYASSLLEYAGIASAVGDYRYLLSRLQSQVACRPLDEATHAALMIALAGVGRQSEALSIYQALRDRLDRELGVLPSPTLRMAYDKVLRQEVKISTSRFDPLRGSPRRAGIRQSSGGCLAW